MLLKPVSFLKKAAAPANVLVFNDLQYDGAGSGLTFTGLTDANANRRAMILIYAGGTNISGLTVNGSGVTPVNLGGGNSWYADVSIPTGTSVTVGYSAGSEIAVALYYGNYTLRDTDGVFVNGVNITGLAVDVAGGGAVCSLAYARDFGGVTGGTLVASNLTTQERDNTSNFSKMFETHLETGLSANASRGTDFTSNLASNHRNAVLVSVEAA